MLCSGCTVAPDYRRPVDVVGPIPESAIEWRYDKTAYALVRVSDLATARVSKQTTTSMPTTVPIPTPVPVPATLPVKPVRHYPTYEDIRWEQEHEIHVIRVR